MARAANVGGAERRAAIISELAAATQPVSGSALAKAVGVSRQVVVQDIALLRADGHDIVATSRGYVLQEGKGTPQVPTRLLKVHHGPDDLEDELTTIVDLDGAVLNASTARSRRTSTSGIVATSSATSRASARGRAFR